MDLSWGFLLPVWPPSNPSSQPTSHTSRGHMTSCTLTRLLEYSTLLFSSFPIILSSGFSSSLTPFSSAHHLPTLDCSAPAGCVGPLVTDEVGALREGLSTVITLVGSLPTMHAMVLQQRGGAAEALAAHSTAVGPLACVGALVLNKGGGAVEGLAAVGAAVRAAWQMGAGMDGQNRALAKALAALRALERLFPGVAAGMRDKC